MRQKSNLNDQRDAMYDLKLVKSCTDSRKIGFSELMSEYCGVYVFEKNQPKSLWCHIPQNTSVIAIQTS